MYIGNLRLKSNKLLLNYNNACFCILWTSGFSKHAVFAANTGRVRKSYIKHVLHRNPGIIKDCKSVLQKLLAQTSECVEYSAVLEVAFMVFTLMLKYYLDLAFVDCLRTIELTIIKSNHLDS